MLEAKEGMARQGEHRISFTENAAGGSGEGVGAGIVETVTCPPIEPSVDEHWIEELEQKFERAFEDSPRQSRPPADKKELIICKSAALDVEFSRPKVVTIGPFHRHDSKRIDKEKLFVMQLMSRLYNLDLVGCAQKMKNQEAEALRCYSFSDKPPCFDSTTGFAEILLLDGFFILLMLTSNKTFRKAMQTYSEPDSSREQENTQFRDDLFRFLDIIMQKNEIMLDLLILDNQIPFVAVEELYKELKLEKPLHEYALKFFKTIHPTPNQRSEGQNMPDLQFLHLLDLFHWSRVPKDKYRAVHTPHKELKDSIDLPRHTPTAMELRESATMFAKKTSGSSLDITFRSGRLMPVVGVLNIPRLHIHDYSSHIFHNLIAFEMQCPSRGCCAMAFSAFMRSLLQSEEDVKLLRRRGILASTSVTDSELVDFFKRLSKLTENRQMPIDLYNVYHRVLSHHNRRMSRFCGSIVLQYFPNPLVTLSVFAAILLFVLNILQTIYTVLSYYHS